MKNAILLKYGELALRGKNRYLFENRLIQRIRDIVADEQTTRRDATEFVVHKEQGRIVVEPARASQPPRDWIGTLIPRLKTVIGLTGISSCIKTENLDIEDLREKAIQYMQTYHGGKNITFKVETRRANKAYPLLSQEISSEIGGYILENMPETAVDVHHPEVVLYIELRTQIYIYSDMEKCIGGLPVGSCGRGLLLLSGGIDSPVAGYLAAKRGVELEAVYFHSPPYTSERAKIKVLDLLERLSLYTGQIKLHIVPFTDIQLFLRDNVPGDKLTVFLKRAMLNISQEIAVANKCRILINGDSIGQVASQNLASMAAIGSAAHLPLIRPLACFDKQEIVDLAIKIGTYDISIRPYEDCCTLFVAKHPELSPKQSVIEGIERGLEGLQELLQSALANTEVVIN